MRFLMDWRMMGAQNKINSISFPFLLYTYHEIKASLRRAVSHSSYSCLDRLSICSPKLISTIMCLRLNTWKTKFSLRKCVCKNDFSIKHILCDCPITKKLLQLNDIVLSDEDNLEELLYSPSAVPTAKILCQSAISSLL